MRQIFQQGWEPHMRAAEKRIACGLAGALVVLALTGAAVAQQPAPKPTPPRPAPTQHQAPAPAVQAQAPQAQAAPADQNPQRTTASYGDWVVRCETTAGPPPQKNCDMEQLAQVQGQANPISRVAVPLPPKGEPAKLFVQLPINVSFSAPLKIVADSKDAGISTPFRRCVPAGCFAEIELKDDLQKKFRASAEPGKILFKDAADRDVAIPLSFKGFGQAFEALLKQ
jgi:invasion protein IalB